MAQGNFSLIVEDLKTSWYFRIWAILWIICAIFSFVGLIVLSHSSDEAQLKPGWRIWVEHRESAYYPDFEITLFANENLTDSITTCNCFYGKEATPVGTAPCKTGQPITQCVQVQSSSFQSYKSDETVGFPFFTTDSIHCYIINEAQNVTADDRILAVAVGNIQNKPTPNFVAPGTRTEIRFLERQIQYRKMPVEVNYETQTGVVSNINNNPSSSIIFFKFAHLHVDHFQETDVFNGWMGVGVIGGFCFFLYLLHAIIMALIGICVPNTSKFLGGSREEGYRNL